MKKEAVILFNMGGASNYDEIKIFLTNLFNDVNVINIKNKHIRKLVSFFIILKIRKNVESHYERINYNSPIKKYTEKLVEKLNELDENKYYTYVMNYTYPFASDCLADIKKQNIKNITLFSMYPQYSVSTTNSSLESIYAQIDKNDFNIKIIDRYYNNYQYNKIIVKKIQEKLKDKNSNEYILIISAHSLPQKLIDNGDPYQNECEKNYKIIKEILKTDDINFKNIELAYQSKFGRRTKWLEPSTLSIIEKYKNENIIIYPLSFTIDNSETHYELNIEYREKSINEYNIKDFLVCDCPNFDDDFAEFIKNTVNKN